MWWDLMTTRQLTAHYYRSQQQKPAPVLVLVGGDGQDSRAIHGSSRSATVHPSAFVLNGPRLVVVATLGWRNGPLLSTRSDDDDTVPRKRWRGWSRTAWMITSRQGLAYAEAMSMSEKGVSNSMSTARSVSYYLQLTFLLPEHINACLLYYTIDITMVILLPFITHWSCV